ncbi:LORF2 protein, partial [Crocuta crocuta]
IHMFIAALFTIVKIWKQCKCPLVGKWIKKMWCMCKYICLYVMECYSATKRNEILPFATTWIDLEGIIINEIRHRNKYRTIS